MSSPKDLVLSERSLPPTIDELNIYSSMSQAADQSKMYLHLGGPAGIMAIMLSARELGIGPMKALNGGLFIVKGKVELSAMLMSGLIRRAGHSIQIQSESADECVLVGQRCDSKDTMTVSFTLEEAKRAGLVKPGSGWMTWPRDMMYARALSRLSRRLFADVIGGCYVQGEISEGLDTTQAITVESIKHQDTIPADVVETLEGYVDWKKDILKLCNVKQIHEIKNHQLEAVRNYVRAKQREAKAIGDVTGSVQPSEPVAD